MSEIENMFSFNETNIEKIVNRLGYSISNPKNYIKENDEIQHCKVCTHDITKDNLGMIIPGSKILLCDNPACFSKYLVTREENHKGENEKK